MGEPSCGFGHSLLDLVQRKSTHFWKGHPGTVWNDLLSKCSFWKQDDLKDWFFQIALNSPVEPKKNTFMFDPVPKDIRKPYFTFQLPQERLAHPADFLHGSRFHDREPRR